MFHLFLPLYGKNMYYCMYYSLFIQLTIDIQSGYFQFLLCLFLFLSIKDNAARNTY